MALAIEGDKQSDRYSNLQVRKVSRRPDRELPSEIL